MKMDSLFFVMFLNVVHLAVTNDQGTCGPGLCCSGFVLKDNICTECHPGTYGINCSEECSKGLYGRACKEKCPTECVRSCNIPTGICPENNRNETPSLMNNSTTKPDTHNNFEKKIENFLKDKLWIIAGASSVLVLISCSCIGLFLLCKVCKSRQKKKGTLDNGTPSNQYQLSSCSERYQSDISVHNNAASPVLPPRAQNCGGAKSSTDKSETDKPEVEYSKPKPKKHYSLVQKLKVSQELTCPEMSDEEVFDSDEFEDFTNTSGGVEISGFPMKQSFNTFLSSGVNKLTKKGTSTNYGHIW